jgi:nucleoside-diphosphate-sugar epimerase
LGAAVLVTGGTGTLSRNAVRILRQQGHEMRVLSRRTGADLRTGAGVREAADGIELWPGRLRVLPLPIVGRTLRAFADGRNTTPELVTGRLTWPQYLGSR